MALLSIYRYNVIIKFILTQTVVSLLYRLGQMGLMQILEWKKEFTRMEDISLLLRIHQTKTSGNEMIIKLKMTIDS